MKEQFRAALRSLPWYIVGGFLFGPLILAPFTLGSSLAIYLMPIALFSGPGKYETPAAHEHGQLIALALIFGPGLFVWILRQFWRFAFHAWWTNRSANLYRSSGNITPRS